MRLVIDTNQVNDIVNGGFPHDSRPTLVIAPLIWAEIIKGSRPYLNSRVQALGKYDLLFGMDCAYMYARLCCLNEDQVREFIPIFPEDNNEHKGQRNGFLSPRPEHFQRAKELREMVSRERKILFARIRECEKENKDAESRGEQLTIEKFSSIEEADTRFISGKNAPLRTSLVANITEDNTHGIQAASRESLYDAILANPSLRRWLRLKITFDLAYLDAWSCQALNDIADLQANRNDVPDMLLALFARDGDAILTNDKRLQTAFRHCDPLGKVGISTWVSHFQNLS